MRMGKDTVGDIIASHTGLQKRAFAAAVKELTRTLFQINDIEEWKCRNEPPPGMIVTMRHALQIVGDGMRQISPSIWVDHAMADPMGIFCDVRYANEARAIREHGGTLVLIGRSLCLNDDTNPSEAHLRPIIAWFLTNTRDPCVRISQVRNLPEHAASFDWFVRNDMSIDDLQNAVCTLLNATDENSEVPLGAAQ